MLVDNNSLKESLDVDRFQKALLININSIDPVIKASQALIMFGRAFRDASPVLMGTT